MVQRDLQGQNHEPDSAGYGLPCNGLPRAPLRTTLQLLKPCGPCRKSWTVQKLATPGERKHNNNSGRTSASMVLPTMPTALPPTHKILKSRPLHPLTSRRYHAFKLFHLQAQLAHELYLEVFFCHATTTPFDFETMLIIPFWIPAGVH